MTDCLRRVALVTFAFCALTSAAEADTPSPSFAVRVEGRGPAMISDPARVEVVTRWAAASDPEAASVMLAELMTTDLREQVAAIRTPVLLVAAVKAFASMPDGAARVMASYREQVRKVPSHDVVPATNALHFVMFDDLRFLLRTMDSFLTPASGSVQ